MRIHLTLAVALLIALSSIRAQDQCEFSKWRLYSDKGTLEWLPDRDLTVHYPHEDHIAMSGFSVDMILEWQVDSNREFSATRVIRWPMLRTIPDDTHASLQRRLNDIDDPVPVVDGQPLRGLKMYYVIIHNDFTVSSRSDGKLERKTTIFPSMQSPAIIDYHTLTNLSDGYQAVEIPEWRHSDTTEAGTTGRYVVEQFVIGDGQRTLAPGESYHYAVIRTARELGAAPYYGLPETELQARHVFAERCRSELVLETPESSLDNLFAFSKIRAAESIFSTRGGLMHGPGGYNKYLAAIWANDQAEYINPFFPFLGYEPGNESAMNSFRHFARYINPEFKPIPSSIIAEGRDYWNGAGDRGDMAMIAYGAARFALASGNKAWAAELWPLIEWCLEFSRRKKTGDGVIASDTDELEGRFPAGDANLCTSSLYYDALISSAMLADELEMSVELSGSLLAEAAEIREAISSYFEDTVEGFDTYRYYDGNDILRSWICVPLTVGIYDKAEGTVDALFSERLWTDNGLLTQAGEITVWDRSTLYALRGVLAAGMVEEGLVKLTRFSLNRLFGDHVPYVIEAYPEFNQSHLSAESGLYCRIFTEGLFGIRPTGFTTFECTPRLPERWETMALRRIHAFGRVWDMEVSRVLGHIYVRITDTAGNVLVEKTGDPGDTFTIQLAQ